VWKVDKVGASGDAANARDGRSHGYPGRAATRPLYTLFDWLRRSDSSLRHVGFG